MALALADGLVVEGVETDADAVALVLCAGLALAEELLATVVGVEVSLVGSSVEVAEHPARARAERVIRARKRVWRVCMVSCELAGCV